MSLPLPLSLVTLACGCFASTAPASQTTMKVGFEPYRLGSSTTVAFAFTVTGEDEAVPSPMTSISLRLPAQVVYATSSLGLASCNARALTAHGVSGCPVNSRIGFGSALVALPLGPTLLQERIQVSSFVSSSANGQLEVLYYASGNAPVIARLLFPGELLQESSGSSINTSIPLIATLPEAPDASVIDFDSTIGPKNLYYQARAHGRTIRYHPRGIVLPTRCPRGGFRFSAAFHFQDDVTRLANSTVPCPRNAGGS